MLTLDSSSVLGSRRQHHRLVLLGLVALALGLLGAARFAAPALAAEAPTHACVAALQSGGGRYVQRRADALETCLRAALTCRQKSTATARDACRARLVTPGSGACAVGILDAGSSTLGAGSSRPIVDDPTRTDRLSAAGRDFLAAVDEACFVGAPAVDWSVVLGSSSAPTSAVELVDRLNRVPGGLGCLANVEVGITTVDHPGLIAELAAFNGACVVAEAPVTLKTPCRNDADCGPSTGRCGRLALALREGSRGLSDCAPCGIGEYRAAGGCAPCAVGHFSDKFDAPSCETCAPGTFAASAGSTTCSNCSAGTAAPSAGASSCISCQPGSFSGSRATSCTDCPAEKYSSASQSATCETCPPHSAPSSSRDTCLCDTGYYQDTRLPSFECIACPEGADCTRPGTTFDTLTPLPGYWRPTADSDVFYRVLRP